MSAERFVRRTSMAGTEHGREFCLDWGDQSRVTEVRIWTSTIDIDSAAADSMEAGDDSAGDAFVGSLEMPLVTIAAMQVAWELDDGQPLVSPVIGPVPLDLTGHPSAPHDTVTLGEADILNGVHGHVGAGRVNSLGLVTPFAALDPLGSTVGVPYGWTLTELSAGFDPDALPTDNSLAPDALICGIFGRFDRVGLRAIGLRCTVAGAGPTLVAAGPGGRMVRADAIDHPPKLAQAPAAPGELDIHANRVDHTGVPARSTDRPNPNYEPIVVRRVDQWDDELRIHADDGTPGRYRFVERSADHQRRRAVDTYIPVGSTTTRFAPGAVATVFPATATANLLIELPDGESLTPSALPAPAASDGPTWDNVFGLDHRIDYLDWATRGIDISEASPFNLQEATGALRGNIFRAPVPGSRDFHIAYNGAATVVPNGWRFVGDVTGSTKARTTSAFSDEESRLSWATSLGISAEADGFGAKVAYKNNSKAHDEVSVGSSGKVASTITETIEIDHALVLDSATVELSDEFRTAVESLALDPTRDHIAQFLRRFGNHFAHAVTFGSKTWEQRHETEASLSDSMTHGSSVDQSVEAGFHAPVGGASGSVSWSKSGESTQSSKRGTGLEVSSQGSIGSATEPVPIMLQVVELIELLNPVFFDDPFVHDDLRTHLNEFLDEFPTEHDYDTTRGELNFDISPGDFSDNHDGRYYSYRDAKFWVHGGVAFDVPNDVVAYMRQEEQWRGIGIVPTFPKSSVPATSEGKLVRSRDELDGMWWIRGGKRHFVALDPGDPILSYFGNGFRIMLPEVLAAAHSDSAVSATLDGRMIGRQNSREVWWLSDGKAHRIPSSAVVEVLGGWQLVTFVNDGMFNRLIYEPPLPGSKADAASSDPNSARGGSERYAVSKVAASVNGKMVRSADDATVWVIHDRQRHKVPDDLGVRKRGGWSNVAIVRDDVIGWFPASDQIAV